MRSSLSWASRCESRLSSRVSAHRSAENHAVAVEPEVARLRSEVSKTERAILELVIQRVDLARQIWELKLGRQIALLDPAREVELLGELRIANDGRLSAAGLVDLHSALLALTRRELERRLDPM